MYQVCKIKDRPLLFCDQIIFFKTEFKKSEEEAEIKKDNPKEILYEFLNLIGNQEKNLFAPPPVFKKPAGATKKLLNFK